MSITGREIEQIRKEQAKFMPEWGILKRREFFGDNEQSYHQLDDNPHRIRVTPGFGIWRSIADRFQGITAFTITVAHDVDVRAADVWLVGEQVFEVRDVKAPSSYLTAKQCLCDLTTDG